MLPFLHEDFEYLPYEEGASVRGHDALRRYFERWMESWDEYEMGPTVFLSGEDCVFTGVALKARGHGSGINVAMNAWQVWRVRDGRAAQCEEYPERTEALDPHP